MRRRCRSPGSTCSGAREILQDRPGTAATLASTVLIVLDELAAARRDVSEAG